VKPFVRYWMHGGMLMVSGEEMHKSLGNFWAVVDALKTFDCEVLRFFLLNAHYRSPIDFTVEAMEEAGRSYQRLLDTYQNLSQVARRAPEGARPADVELDKAAATAKAMFEEAMDDDFNSREAIAAIFVFASEINKAVEAGIGRVAAQRSLDLLDEFGEVLGLFQKVRRGKLESTDAVLDMLVQIREDARKRKDFATSDLIRDRLKDVGVVLEDAKDGVRWKWK